MISFIRSSAVFGAFAFSLFAVNSANAVTLTLGALPIFQQTDNNPCVIGNPSCNNPAGFDYTLIPANTEASTLDSPTYTIGQIRNLVGDNFVLGIDLQEPDDDYDLISLTLLIDGNVEFEYGGSLLGLNNHGNGFSDWTLNGFDISAFNAASIAVFHLVYADAQSAREQFFLASGAPVPEPASCALLGAGALFGLVRRRRARSAA